jgi:hypothetical protein
VAYADAHSLHASMQTTYICGSMFCFSLHENICFLLNKLACLQLVPNLGGEGVDDSILWLSFAQQKWAKCWVNSIHAFVLYHINIIFMFTKHDFVLYVRRH